MNWFASTLELVPLLEFGCGGGLRSPQTITTQFSREKIKCMILSYWIK